MRTLFDCLHSKYPTHPNLYPYIMCDKGHDLGRKVHIRMVERGDKLECKACQNCPDYSPMND